MSKMSEIKRLLPSFCSFAKTKSVLMSGKSFSK